MPRHKLYESAAEKQAAYRERLKRETMVVDRRAMERLEKRLELLSEAVDRAWGAGDEFAQQCVAGSVDTMLEKMKAAFDRRAAELSETPVTPNPMTPPPPEREPPG